MNILLVDDEPFIVEELGGFLHRRGHGVVNADGVESAIRALHQQGPFDVVLSDMCMPDGSGLDVVRAWRHTAEPRPAMVVMSGHAGPEEIARALGEGAARFLAKPVSLRAVTEAIAGLINATT
jgi:DNA-binding NtrC family response regulator